MEYCFGGILYNLICYFVALYLSTLSNLFRHTKGTQNEIVIDTQHHIFVVIIKNKHQFAKPLSTLELEKKTVMKHSKSLYHCVWSHRIEKQVIISLCLELLSQNRKIQKENIVHWTGVSRVSRDNMHLRREYLLISSTRVSVEIHTNMLWIRFFHLGPSLPYCHVVIIILIIMLIVMVRNLLQIIIGQLKLSQVKWF